MGNLSKHHVIQESEKYILSTGSVNWVKFIYRYKLSPTICMLDVVHIMLFFHHQCKWTFTITLWIIWICYTLFNDCSVLT